MLNKLDRKKILLLVPSFDLQRPRNIRAQNMFSFLSNDYDIHLLKFTHPNKKRKIENVKTHALDISRFSSYFLNNEFSQSKIIQSRNVLRRVISKLYSRFWLFPDMWSYESKNILRYFRSVGDTKKFDYVIASIKPFSNAKLAVNLKALKAFEGSKIILDIGDPLTNNSADRNSSTQRNSNFESKYLNLADHIIVTNQETKDYYNTEFSLSYSKLTVIPQGANIKLFQHLHKETEKSKIIKLIYAGNFYKKLREPDQFISALQKISNSKEIQVSFFGSNAEPSEFIKTYESVPQEELIKVYNSSDVLLFFDNAFGIQTSGKIYELLSLKKPILFIYSNEGSSLLTLVKNFKNVILVKNKAYDIAQALLSLDETLMTIGDVTYPIEQFSWKARAEQIRSLLESISL